MLVLTKNQAKAKADVLTKFLAERDVSLPASDLLNAIARMAGREDWNAMAAMYRPEAVDALLQDFELQHAQDSVDPAQASNGFGDEICIQTASGFWMVMSADNRADYLRVCDPSGREVVYWAADEFGQDPVCVLGALRGVLNRGREDLMPNPLRPSADKLVVTDRSGKNKPAKLRSNLSELPWSSIVQLSVCPAGCREEDALVYFLHNGSEIDIDVFELVDAERNGTCTDEQIEELDGLNEQTQIDWGDEFNMEGITVQELRHAVQNPDRSWTLSDGRTVRFYRLETV
jgi:hypothetical protein